MTDQSQSSKSKTGSADLPHPANSTNPMNSMTTVVPLYFIYSGCQPTRHTVNSSQPKIVWRVAWRLKHRVWRVDRRLKCRAVTVV